MGVGAATKNGNRLCRPLACCAFWPSTMRAAGDNEMHTRFVIMRQIKIMVERKSNAVRAHQTSMGLLGLVQSSLRQIYNSGLEKKTFGLISVKIGSDSNAIVSG